MADTSVWVDHLRGVPTPACGRLVNELDSRTLVVPDLVAHEVLSGIRDEARFVRVRRDLIGYGIEPTVSPVVSLLAVDHYRSLQSLGITVRSTIDCLIASYCIANGHELLHSDRDYVPYEEHFGLGTPQLAS